MLEREDWEESRCCAGRQEPSFHEEEHAVRIPARQVVEELDAILETNDTARAEEHLKLWLGRAREGKDQAGELTVLNEMMGFYRSVGKEAEGMRSVEDGLRLMDSMELKGSVTAGTTWINAATTMKAFGRADQALPLYEKAWRAYSGNLDPSDYRIAGLSNNMALAYVDLGEFAHAERYYKKAVSIMERLPGGRLELAVTYVNLACMYEAWGHCAGLPGKEAAPEDWDERIWSCLDTAWEYLDGTDVPRNGYYAFNCSKCAGTFGYFGQFRRKRELEERAKAIYEGGAGNR